MLPVGQLGRKGTAPLGLDFPVLFTCLPRRQGAAL